MSRPESSGPAFGPRLARAVLVLLGAAALHVWGISPRRPVVSPELTTAHVNAAVDSRTIAAHEPAGSRRLVVETTFVRIPRPVAAFEQPTDTRLAAALLPAATSGRVSPAVAAPLWRPVAIAEPAPASDPAVPASSDDSTPIALASPASATLDADVAEAPSGPNAGPEANGAEDVRRQREIVLAVLHEYSRAYGRLDVGATKAVYPTIDDRKLRRAFQELQSQQVHFAKCGVSFSTSGADANAQCRGDATYRPKMGSKIVRLTDREWTFSLARAGSGWQILDARMQ